MVAEEVDSLADIVALLRPTAVLSKLVRGAGRWAVHYPPFRHPSFAVVLHGSCWLSVAAEAPVQLHAGDFVLFPATPEFTLASDQEAMTRPIEAFAMVHEAEDVVHGDAGAEPSLSLLGAWFTLDPTNAHLLLDLLPRMLLVPASDPAAEHIAPLVDLVRQESTLPRPGGSLVLSRLAEILLVEAIRSPPLPMAASGLLAGLRDRRLAAALNLIHAAPACAWPLATLAQAAGMSRSAFSERFSRVVGRSPAAYLLHWRLALAKDLLVREGRSVGETALAVGYQSASAFSTAFAREVGRPPKDFTSAQSPLRKDEHVQKLLSSAKKSSFTR